MDGAPVTVTVVGSRIEAELIVGLLRSHGSSAVRSADDAGGQEPQLQLQGVRVLVAAADEASAGRLLAVAPGGADGARKASATGCARDQAITATPADDTAG
ncbi:MAG: hypothetical protein JNM77_09365 [Pseudonocardia sp.]|nr:hypothetical protein [Pseudonocardia sp.]